MYNGEIQMMQGMELLSVSIGIICILYNIYAYYESTRRKKILQQRGIIAREQLRYLELEGRRQSSLSQRIQIQNREPESEQCPHCGSIFQITGSIQRPDGSIQCPKCFKTFN